jgi:hypothetical protein
MPEPQAQRTLVKSPPEIWAEVSDVATLARHLGEFGEIRITRLEAETTVVWEGDTARGTVELVPSGWGTKVTLTAQPLEAGAAEGDPAAAADPAAATDPAPAADPAAADPAGQAQAEAAAPEPVFAPEPDAAEPAAATTAEPPVAALPAVPEPKPEPAPAPEPRRGRLARWFRRRRRAEPVTVVPEPASADPMTVVVEPVPEPIVAESATTDPMTVVPDPEPIVAESATTDPMTVVPEPEPVVAESATADPMTVVVEAEAESVVAESAPDPEPVAPPFDPTAVAAVLVGVLDDLGAAHHRPFSRG